MAELEGTILEQQVAHEREREQLHLAHQVALDEVREQLALAEAQNGLLRQQTQALSESHMPAPEQPQCAQRELGACRSPLESAVAAGGGGNLSPGVISQMNPGPYRPLYLWGWRVGSRL